MFRLIDLIADRALDAVTFTSAPAVAALMDAAGSTGRRDEVIAAFQADVVASCVGPVTAAAFEMWGVPTIFPDRSRLVAMVKQLETELPSRRDGHRRSRSAGHTAAAARRRRCSLDGVEVELSPAPLAVLQALVVNPGHVVSRRELLAALPGGHRRLRARRRDGGRPAARRARHPRRADRGQARLPAGGARSRCGW